MQSRLDTVANMLAATKLLALCLWFWACSFVCAFGHIVLCAFCLVVCSNLVAHWFSQGARKLVLLCSFRMQVTTALPEASASTRGKEADEKVGRWGEELVYRRLLHEQQESADGWKVEWVNEAFNTAAPYDIRLRQAFSTTAQCMCRTKVLCKCCPQLECPRKSLWFAIKPEYKSMAYLMALYFNTGLSKLPCFHESYASKPCR